MSKHNKYSIDSIGLSLAFGRKSDYRNLRKSAELYHKIKKMWLFQTSSCTFTWYGEWSSQTYYS